MTPRDGTGPLDGRQSAARAQEDAVVARLQQLSAGLDDAPDPRFRAATRDRLVAMASVRTPRPAPRSGLRRLLAGRADAGPAAGWRTRLIAGLAGAAMTVTALGMLVALSTDARPGDALYGVKRGTEQTRLAVAGDDRALTLLGFAETRLDELAALRDATAGDVVGLLDTMDAQTVEGASLLTTRAVGDRDTAPVDGLAGWTDRQTTELTALRAGLPAGAASASQQSLDLLATVSVRATRLQAALSCADGPVTAGTDELGPVPAQCPAGAPDGDAPADAPPSGDTGVLPGDAPTPDVGDPPAGTSTGSSVPAPQPAPAPVPPPSAPRSGSGDPGSGTAPGDDGGTAPEVPDTPAVESPLPVPDLPPLPPPTPSGSADPDDAPLPDTPLPSCTRPPAC